MSLVISAAAEQRREVAVDKRASRRLRLETRAEGRTGGLSQRLVRLPVLDREVRVPEMCGYKERVSAGRGAKRRGGKWGSGLYVVMKLGQAGAARVSASSVEGPAADRRAAPINEPASDACWPSRKTQAGLLDARRQCRK